MRTHEGEGGRSEIELREVHSFAAPRVGIVAVPIKNVTGGHPFRGGTVQVYRGFAVTVPFTTMSSNQDPMYNPSLVRVVAMAFKERTLLYHCTNSVAS